MIYRIDHKIEYRYSQPVFLEPHQLHLTPREDGFQKLQQFTLRLDPEPMTLTRILDLSGNSAHEVWFKGNTSRFFLETSSVVEVTRTNPFDYLLRENAMRLPAKYSPALFCGLRPYLGRPEDDSDRVRFFAEAAASRTGYDAVGFLSELCLLIHAQIRHMRREEGAPWTPEKTLMEGKGACRDLSVLFIACCRSQGLAARFTSGYAELPSTAPGNELHAWAEVYLEGAGWRGYDPSAGLAVCEQHVALASSYDSLLVTPVAGTFRGKNISSQMQAQVTLRPLAEFAV